MKLFRYRRPSFRTMIGYTAAVRRLRRAVGISTVQRYTNPSRIKQRFKQRAGLYSPTMTVLRQASRGRFPSFLGWFGGRRSRR